MKGKGFGWPGLKCTVVNQTSHSIKAVILIDIFYQFLRVFKNWTNVSLILRGGGILQPLIPTNRLIVRFLNVLPYSQAFHQGRPDFLLGHPYTLQT